MNSQDLICIGRLGGLDTEGFFHLMIKPDYREMLPELREVFLIFSSHRVFYVNVSSIKEADKKLWIKFKEDGIKEERNKHKEAHVALAPDDLEDEDSELDAYLGYTVYYQGKLLGTLSSYFHNNAQYVLEILTPSSAELLVPYVDHYLAELLPETGQIVLQNLDPLLEDAGLTLED